MMSAFAAASANAWSLLISRWPFLSHLAHCVTPLGTLLGLAHTGIRTGWHRVLVSDVCPR
jgi:hypothetical protein